MNARHDELVVDWRQPRPKMAVRRKPSVGLRAGVMKAIEAFRAIPGGEPSNWRDAAIFLIGSAWGVMLTLGLLLAVQP